MLKVRLLGLIAFAVAVTAAGLLLWHPANPLEFGLKSGTLFVGGLLVGRLISRFFVRAA